MSLATVVLAAASVLPCHAAGEKAVADVLSRDGKDLGRAKFSETTAGILIKLQLKGLPAGEHGFHIHETGKCEGDFKSAGGIYNPIGAKHGFLNDEGPMAGDLPNLHVPANGELVVELLTPFVTLSKDVDETLFDADGSALIIHERPDDYKSDPEGNSGSRIACGVITVRK